MSIIDALDPNKRIREDLQRQQQLSESMARIGAQFGLTQDELLSALWGAVNAKRLSNTARELNGMRLGKVTTF